MCRDSVACDSISQARSTLCSVLLPSSLITLWSHHTRWGTRQGGVRASVTTGRVDWAVTEYRGFESTRDFVYARLKIFF